MALTQVSRGLLSTSIVDNGNATAITIDSSENVGIGMSPTTNNISKSISLVNGGSIFGYGAGTYITGNSNYNGAWNTVATGADSRILLDGNVVFSRSSSASAGSQGTVSESMRITSDGNVGINTSSPTDTLSVGTLGSGSNSIITIGASTTGTSSVYFGDGVSAGRFRGYFDYEHTNDALAIGTAGTERMRIDSSGNLLVGTTSTPSLAGLAVGSTTTGKSISVFSSANGSNGIIGLYQSSGTQEGQLYAGTGDINLFGTSVVKIVASSGGVKLNTNATSWVSNSDERAKEIIEPITNAAQKVSTLRAVIGKYKTDSEETRRSFLIAQDVQAVLPEAVDATDEDNLGVRYTETIPLLVAAIKEQQETITALTARIEQLENN